MTSSPESSDTPDGQVILFNDELTNYIEATNNATPAEKAEEYRTSLATPITKDCIDSGEYAELAASLIATPITDTQAASKALAGFDPAEIESSLTNELETLQQALPGPPVTVCIVIAGDDTAAFIAAQMNGVTGVTAGTGRVILLIDPATVSDEAVRYTLAHEYFHSWWTSHQSTMDRLRDRQRDRPRFHCRQPRLDNHRMGPHAASRPTDEHQIQITLTPR